MGELGSYDDLKVEFFQECEELLEATQDALQRMSRDGNDEEALKSAFRAVHTIKGGAGSFGLVDVVRQADAFETALDFQSERPSKCPKEHLLMLQERLDLLAKTSDAASLPFLSVFPE